MSHTIEATAADYLTDACRINSTTVEACFGRPLSNARSPAHLRWECLRLAKALALDDGLTFAQDDWALACGMSPSAVGRIAQRQPARFGDIQAVIDATCQACGVKRELLGENGRHPSVVDARMLVTRAARMLTVLSYPEIARAIGRPNHSTVITADQRLSRHIASGKRPELMQRLDAILMACEAQMEVAA